MIPVLVVIAMIAVMIAQVLGMGMVLLFLDGAGALPCNTGSYGACLVGADTGRQGQLSFRVYIPAVRAGRCFAELDQRFELPVTGRAVVFIDRHAARVY